MGQPSGTALTMLSPFLRVAQAMQFDLCPKDEGILAADRRVD